MNLTNDFRIELDNGKMCIVTIECRGFYENYGADRDGNRGTRMFFTEHETVTSVANIDNLTVPEIHDAEQLALEMSCDFDWSQLYMEDE